MNKECFKCKRILPIEDFYQRKATGTYNTYCKSCDLECKRLSREKNRQGFRPELKNKMCPRCKIEQPVSSFRKDTGNRDGLKVYCNTCSDWYHAEYVKRHPQIVDPAKARAATARYRTKHKVRIKKYEDETRELVLDAYGGRACLCCGEKQRIFLTIDHIDPKTKRGFRDVGINLHLKLRRAGFPPGYQVLCMNCNFGKYINGGVCPHKAAQAFAGQLLKDFGLKQ